jgi:uncharacterized protein YbjT (DUF2867 family)
METAADCPGGLVSVTGGSGFIGSWLVRRLLDCGYAVHATVKNIRASRALFPFGSNSLVFLVLDL